MAALAASGRMYSVSPAATQAWFAFFDHVALASGVKLDIVEHAFPARLDALWGREDLGCAFMCGWPVALENQARAAAHPPEAPRTILAAPVPSAAWSQGQPIYRSDFIVAAASAFHTIEDTFGHRFAFNAIGSHSGANAPRLHLSQWAAQAPLFREMVGPLTTVRRCVEAVASGAAEVSAVDSFALDLLRRHDPELAAQIRVIASTAPSPIPPLVASAAREQDIPLRRSLLAMHLNPTGQTMLAELCLDRFTEVTRETYVPTLAVAPAAAAAGYSLLA